MSLQFANTVHKPINAVAFVVEHSQFCGATFLRHFKVEIERLNPAVVGVKNHSIQHGNTSKTSDFTDSQEPKFFFQQALILVG
eukprot:6140730-Amphidinium_carterae.1